MSKNIKFKVDDAEIIINKLPVYQGSLILTKLKKMLGGSLISVGASALVKTDDEEQRNKLQLEAIGKALNEIAERNTAEAVHALWEEMLCDGSIYIKRDGQASSVTSLNDFDDLNMMYAVLLKCVSLNFGDFIKKFMSSIASQKASMKELMTQ